MSTTKFTDDHEWVAVDENGLATVGITDYAQEQLGELVFVELPEVGDEVSQGNETCIIESVKAAGEIKSPLSGEIVEVNEALNDEPGRVNEDPEGEGWFYKLKLSASAELDELKDEQAYRQYVAGLD